MIDILSKWTIILFGIFFICVGLLMLFNPKKANDILRTSLVDSGKTILKQFNVARVEMKQIETSILSLMKKEQEEQKLI